MESHVPLLPSFKSFKSMRGKMLITFKSRIITQLLKYPFSVDKQCLRSDLVHFTMWNIAVICQNGLWSLRGKEGVQTGNELVKHTFCTTGPQLTITPHPQCGIMTHRNQRGGMLLNLVRKDKPQYHHWNLLILSALKVVAYLVKGRMRLRSECDYVVKLFILLWVRK